MALAAWGSSEEPPWSANDFQAELWRGWRQPRMALRALAALHKGQQLLGDSPATVTALTLLEGAGGRGKVPLHGCSPLSQQLGDTQGNPSVYFGRQARAVASLCVFP